MPLPLIRPAGDFFASRSPVLARSGMAATSQPLATQIAVDILKSGGSAVDAAIAANAALGLVEPVSCGIGGDLFAIVWDPKTKRLHGLNASGRSPRGLSFEEMQDRVQQMGRASIPPYGPLSVSVPGAVDGWFELHGRFGVLPMEALLEPAIHYAREGFPVSQVIAAAWDENLKVLDENPEMVGELENLRATYTIDGRAPQEGEVFRNPDLAATYERIARGGNDAFYRGEIADTLDRYMARIGGYLRRTDMEAHSSSWIDPVATNYRGHDVFELPPNGQGIAVLQMLNILESFDLHAMGHNATEYLHLLIEAKKLAYEDRARFYADPDFYTAPVEELISRPYAAKRRGLISGEAIGEVHSGDAYPSHGDTIYLTTADASGMMVSLIESNYRGMGSGLVPDGLGFGLQNRGELFTLEKGHPNAYAPGKRPFHTIIPGFVLKDEEPFLSFGVMGGAMQPQGHVQVLCNIIDFGMNVQEAGDAPRFRHDGSSEPTGERMADGGVVYLESGIGEDVADRLRAKGHRVEGQVGSFGGYQAILRRNGVYHGASEMRKDGQAAGY